MSFRPDKEKWVSSTGRLHNHLNAACSWQRPSGSLGKMKQVALCCLTASVNCVDEHPVMWSTVQALKCLAAKNPPVQSFNQHLPGGSLINSTCEAKEAKIKYRCRYRDSAAPPSCSGQEAQIDGPPRDEQGSSFRLHVWRTFRKLNLVVLHQLQNKTNCSSYEDHLHVSDTQQVRPTSD